MSIASTRTVGDPLPMETTLNPQKEKSPRPLAAGTYVFTPIGLRRITKPLTNSALKCFGPKLLQLNREKNPAKPGKITFFVLRRKPKNLPNEKISRTVQNVTSSIKDKKAADITTPTTKKTPPAENTKKNNR